jgi:anhydro-N-acetylmuramic acid kinase
MRVIGLISGTSVDGIDGALVEVEGQGYNLTLGFVEGQIWPYPPELRQRILQVCAGGALTLEALAELDDAIAQEFARAALSFIHRHGPVDLLASHGQTVFHRPLGGPRRGPSPGLGYSIQLGRGSEIACQTQVPTVSDFRRADIEAGGEGAPLVPIVDQCLLSHPHQARCIQNIGGIGNVTYLPSWNRQTLASPPPVLGWDTGPGNSLIDIAIQSLSEGCLTYDQDGAWAARGVPCQRLVEEWLDHPYLRQPPPKSTGRELFGWSYFQRCQRAAANQGLNDFDLVATLTQFTAATIAQSYQDFLPALPDAILVCGGGGYNPVLMQYLQDYLPAIPIGLTDGAGMTANYKEAIAFAVLGFWHRQGFPANLPSVTGASKAVILGQMHYPVSVVSS